MLDLNRMWRVRLNVLVPIRTRLEVWISRSNSKPQARACNHRMRWTSMRWQRVGCFFFFIPICCVHRANLLCVLFEHPRNSGKSVVQQDDKTLIGHWSRRSSFLSVLLRASFLCVRLRLSLHTLTRPNIGLEYIRKINSSVNDGGRRTSYTNSMLSWLHVSTPNERTNEQMRFTYERSRETKIAQHPITYNPFRDDGRYFATQSHGLAANWCELLCDQRGSTEKWMNASCIRIEN